MVDLRIDEANGTAERTVALEMLADTVDGIRDVTMGGDKNYETIDFIQGCRNMNVTPHVAQNIAEHRGSGIDGRTTRHPGYAVSQRLRKRRRESPPFPRHLQYVSTTSDLAAIQSPHPLRMTGWRGTGFQKQPLSDAWSFPWTQ